MADAVSAAKFARNVDHYKLLAQRGAVPISCNGILAGYFVAPHEYEGLLKLRNMRRRFRTAELTDVVVAAVAATRMDLRHDHLNALLDPS